MNTWLLVILIILGYITCGYLMALLNRWVDDECDYIPVAVCIFLFPFVFIFWVLEKISSGLGSFLSYVENSSQKRKLVKGLNIKTVRSFISEHNPLYLGGWKEIKLAKWVQKNIKEKSGYKFNEDDSFVFSFENGQIKIIVSDFLVLGYYDLPESFWKEFIWLAKK